MQPAESLAELEARAHTDFARRRAFVSTWRNPQELAALARKLRDEPADDMQKREEFLRTCAKAASVFEARVEQLTRGES